MRPSVEEIENKHTHLDPRAAHEITRKVHENWSNYALEIRAYHKSWYEKAETEPSLRPAPRLWAVLFWRTQTDWTLKEIGLLLKVTPSRVREFEFKAARIIKGRFCERGGHARGANGYCLCYSHYYDERGNLEAIGHLSIEKLERIARERAQREAKKAARPVNRYRRALELIAEAPTLNDAHTIAREELEK